MQLTRDEETVLSTLYALQEATAMQIANKSGVALSPTYSALSALIRGGYVMRIKKNEGAVYRVKK